MVQAPRLSSPRPDDLDPPAPGTSPAASSDPGHLAGAKPAPANDSGAASRPRRPHDQVRAMTTPATIAPTAPSTRAMPTDRRRTVGLALLVSAQFVVMLDTSIVNVAL